AERIAAVGFDPAGQVPPFRAELRMAAFVARQLDGVAGRDRWIRDFGGLSRSAREEQQHGCRTCEAAHQSSFTALTTSVLIACRPLTTAIPAAAATSRRLSDVSTRPGAARSMLQ